MRRVRKSKILLILIVTVMCTGGALKNSAAQHPYKTYTLTHENNTLVKTPVKVHFLNNNFEITHKFIDSLQVYRLDSVLFMEEMPELYEIYGKRINLNFQNKNDSLLIKLNSPEYFTIFSAYHTIKAFDFYEDKFGDLFEFTEQIRHKNLKVYLGEFINCNPEEYVFNPNFRVSPTTVYHEAGHKVFCKLDNTIPIGDVTTLLHNGLLEYFTASIADHPVVGEGFLPSALTRNLAKPVRYPEDKYYYQDFIEDFYSVYKDTLSYGKATQKLFELNKIRAEKCTSKIMMTHQSGLLIAHPLWEIRKQTGKKTMDTLVAMSMKNLSKTLTLRKKYLTSSIEPISDHALWYDFLFALYVTDRELYNGNHIELIRQVFENAGYNTKGVRIPDKDLEEYKSH